MNKDQRLPQRPSGKGQSVPPPEPIVPRPLAPPPAGARENPEPAYQAPPNASPPNAPGTRKAVYTVIESGNTERRRWVRIGIAFVNRDGSYNVLLDALPVTGTLHIRDFPAREAGEGEEE